MKPFYLLLLSFFFLLVKGISEFSLCDCNRPATKGIIDYALPTYCKNKGQNITVHKALYSLYSTEPIRTTLKATMCEKWEKVLKITGTFWIGSFDTVRTQYTVPISAEECRNMKNSNKCGTGDEEHTMVESRGSHTYIAEPTGEGQWMRDKVYRTVNCQVRSINLWQDNATAPVMSPFGKLTDEVLDRSAVVNHNTIIWDVPQAYTSKCDPVRFHDGEGKMYRTNTSARLEDEKDQLAFTYSPEATHLCSGMPAHRIDGIPNAYVFIHDTEGPNPDTVQGTFIPSRTARSLVPSQEATLTTELEFASLDAETRHQLNTIALTRYMWGRIQPVVDRQHAHHHDFVSAGRDNETLKLRSSLNPGETEPWEDFNQEFEFNIDHTLRRLDTNRCVNIDKEEIILSDCTQPTRWTYESNLYLLLDLFSGFCLTIDANQLVMRPCDRKSRKASQMWRFEFRNVYPTFYTPESIGTNEEFRQRQEEIAKAAATDTSSPDAIAHGQLRLLNRPRPFDTCVTTIPRVFSRIYPLYCNSSYDGKHIQKYQIFPDLTLRPLSGQLCVNRKVLNKRGGAIRQLTTGPCSPASPKWFQLTSTQLAAIDLTNLDIEAECLTRAVYSKETVLELEPCSPELRLNTSQQQWKFSDKDTPMDDRFSVQDINMILTHFYKLYNEKDEVRSQRLKLWMDYRPNKGAAFTRRIKMLFEGLASLESKVEDAEDDLRRGEDNTQQEPSPQIPKNPVGTPIQDGPVESTLANTLRLKKILADVSPDANYHGNSTITDPIAIETSTESNKPPIKPINPVPEANLIRSETRTESNEVDTPQKDPNTSLSPKSSDAQKTSSSTKDSVPATLESEDPSIPDSLSLLHRVVRNNHSANTSSSSESKGSPPASSATSNNQEKPPTNEGPASASGTVSRSSTPVTSTAPNSQETSGSTASNSSSKETTKFPVTEKELDVYVKRLLQPLHNDWKQQMALDHENLLAKEAQELYCELLKLRHTQLVVSSQWSGLLSAKSLNFDQCSKITNIGQTLLLQECKTVTVKISAVESRCGFQPFLQYNSQNYTVGKDGLSLHPFDECFWNSHLIPINDKTYFWRHDGNISNGDWIEQPGTIPIQGLDLISGFQHTILKDYDYELRSHYAHEQENFESINILSELMGHLQGEGESSISNLIFSQKKEVDFGNMFTWTNTLKIGFLAVMAIISFALTIQFVRIIIPRIQSRRNNSTSFTPEDIPMLPRTYNPVVYTPTVAQLGARPRSKTHKHDKRIPGEGGGLVYEGCLCPCN